MKPVPHTPYLFNLLHNSSPTFMFNNFTGMLSQLPNCFTPNDKQLLDCALPRTFTPFINIELDNFTGCSIISLEHKWRRRILNLSKSWARHYQTNVQVDNFVGCLVVSWRSSRCHVSQGADLFMIFTNI